MKYRIIMNLRRQEYRVQWSYFGIWLTCKNQYGPHGTVHPISFSSLIEAEDYIDQELRRTAPEKWEKVGRTYE